MSIQSAALLPSSTGAPVVDQALEPASVRHGSAAVQKAYQTALAFEQVLVEQLSKSLSASSGLGGEEAAQEGESGAEEGGSSASGLSSMLPQALSSGVMHAGGLGLAAQLVQQAQASEGGARAGSGGASVGGAGVGGASAPATGGGTAA
jgi:Rod binding domain-containing protein